MSRITDVFQREPGYVAYLTAGDGGLQRSLDAAMALIEGGVNMLEIGIPFTDPVADGPVIQAASERALKANTTLDDVLALVASIRRQTDVPLVLFSYYNPILQGIRHDFLTSAKAVGADGCLVVDLPIEESDPYHEACLQAALAPIYIISPSTPKERIKKIQAKAKGMLYYACRKGVTGIKAELPVGFSEKMAEIKSLVNLPVVAGFGISDGHAAQQVVQHADGFVVGSYFVDAIAKGMSASELTALAKSINPFLSKKVAL